MPSETNDDGTPVGPATNDDEDPETLMNRKMLVVGLVD
jgi:hypothetical protein